MKLCEYLARHKIKCSTLAKELEISYNYACEIKREIAKPSRELSEKIELFTGGQVSVKELRNE